MKVGPGFLLVLCGLGLAAGCGGGSGEQNDTRSSGSGNDSGTGASAVGGGGLSDTSGLGGTGGIQSSGGTGGSPSDGGATNGGAAGLGGTPSGGQPDSGGGSGTGGDASGGVSGSGRGGTSEGGSSSAGEGPSAGTAGTAGASGAPPECPAIPQDDGTPCVSYPQRYACLWEDCSTYGRVAAWCGGAGEDGSSVWGSRSQYACINGPFVCDGHASTGAPPVIRCAEGEVCVLQRGAGIPVLPNQPPGIRLEPRCEPMECGTGMVPFQCLLDAYCDGGGGAVMVEPASFVVSCS